MLSSSWLCQLVAVPDHQTHRPSRLPPGPQPTIPAVLRTVLVTAHPRFAAAAWPQAAAPPLTTRQREGCGRTRQASLWGCDLPSAAAVPATP